MDAHDVVIAGGGPTGLMLAAELALGGVDAVIVERREADEEVEGSRAGGLHSRTIEVLDQRGVADRFLREGQIMQTNGFAGIPLDISDQPTRYNHGLALYQRHIERVLAAWVDELGVGTRRGREVTGFDQDATGITVELAGGQTLRAAYLVGCDGGRSRVRRAAGIDLVGLAPSANWLIAQLEMDDPVVGMRPEGGGIGPVNRDGTPGPYAVVLKQPPDETVGEPTLGEVVDALVAVYGSDFGARSPVWISRFTDAARQAVAYRSGRVLLAGDSAHVHAPYGGQGLNLGVQDAVNLGWKLAQVVRGYSPDSLLDTYHAERHPVGARVLEMTNAQGALSQPDQRHLDLRSLVTEVLKLDGPRRQVGATMAALDVSYADVSYADVAVAAGGDGSGATGEVDRAAERGEEEADGAVHPLVGRRMPDLDLHTSDGSVRLFELLHVARPLLIVFDPAASPLHETATPGAASYSGAGRVRRVDATYEGAWTLPVIGEVPGPAAVLVRPDGHVAWAGDVDDAELGVVITRWFGTTPPTFYGPEGDRAG